MRVSFGGFRRDCRETLTSRHFTVMECDFRWCEKCSFDGSDLIAVIQMDIIVAKINVVVGIDSSISDRMC